MAEIFLIAFSLALDAFAVSVSNGISASGFNGRQAVRMGIYFGAFQFMMPLAGWFLGSCLSAWFSSVDHWIAFGMLAFIGGRMVIDASRRTSEPYASADLTACHMIALSIATSIDALAAGISMALMEVPILCAAAVIGAVAFSLSVLGGLAGRRMGLLFRRHAELTGGLVLIAIGLKLLFEHLMFEI